MTFNVSKLNHCQSNIAIWFYVLHVSLMYPQVFIPNATFLLSSSLLHYCNSMPADFPPLALPSSILLPSKIIFFWNTDLIVLPTLCLNLRFIFRRGQRQSLNSLEWWALSNLTPTYHFCLIFHHWSPCIPCSSHKAALSVSDYVIPFHTIKPF